jgi:hypothetical protein
MSYVVDNEELDLIEARKRDALALAKLLLDIYNKQKITKPPSGSKE